MNLTEVQEKILFVLADECKRNPGTSINGIYLTTLGYKVGAYLGIGAMYDVAKLRDLGLVSEYMNSVIITQKGLDYVKTKRNNKYYWIIGILLILGIIVSIATNNFWYFLSSLVTSIITGVIVYIIAKQ